MCELRSAIFSTEVNIMDEAMTEILQKDCKKWTKRERYTVLTEYIFVMYEEIKDGECSERRVSYFTEGIDDLYTNKVDTRIRTVLLQHDERDAERRRLIDHMKST